MKYICLLFVLLAIMFSYGQKFTGKFDRISYLSGNLQHDFKVSKLKLKEVITKNGQFDYFVIDFKNLSLKIKE